MKTKQRHRDTDGEEHCQTEAAVIMYPAPIYSAEKHSLPGKEDRKNVLLNSKSLDQICCPLLHRNLSQCTHLRQLTHTAGIPSFQNGPQHGASRKLVYRCDSFEDLVQPNVKSPVIKTADHFIHRGSSRFLWSEFTSCLRCV